MTQTSHKADPRVIVTGATGFIGRHMIEALRGVEVHAVARSRPLDWRRDVPLHPIDLLNDPEEFRTLVHEVHPTHMVHLAWSAVPGEFHTAQENYSWPGATVAAVRAFVEAGGKRLLSAGSCAEYGASDRPCSEDQTPILPRTPYGVCKDATRRLLESYSLNSLSLAWARLFFVYGPGERSIRLVPSVIRSLLAGEEALCTEGTQIRDFMHVSDLADALAKVLMSNILGTINIASGEPVAVRDVVRLIGESTGRRDRIHLGALPSHGEDPLITADVRRLREEVGWTPRHHLDSGIKDTIEWWRRGQPRT